MDVTHLAQTAAIYALPLLFAITLHEAAHGYVARHFGDMTAYAQGRVSLNPLRHIDLNGTIVVPLVLIALSGGKFAFGWAKPVPVNFSALRKPRRHMACVAAAGPAVNLLMALGWAIVLKLGLQLPRTGWSGPLVQMAVAGVVVNVVLMVINLLPVLPLDGGRIVAGLLPRHLAWQYGRAERWGGALLVAFIGASLADAWLADGRYLGAAFAPLAALLEAIVRTIAEL
ncbi:MAG TPA: site-2 protease family protein [Burkholderiales bacterium]|nr:site-2 protease family protein [Burkholderiales bacterium]